MRHILLVTVENPHDPKSWSGTPYNILKSLQSQFDKVSVLSSPVPKKSLFNSFLRLILGRNTYPLWMTRYALKAYAKAFDEIIRKVQPDVVLSISSQHLIFASEHKLPIFMISDAPWIAYKEAYKNYETLPLLAAQYAKHEAEVANRVRGIIYPTPWACEEAKNRFGTSANKIHLLPFGANRYCTDIDEVVLCNIRNKNPGRYNFLFVGKDWERKGGPLALDIVSRINQMGFPATLHIVGSNPKIDNLKDVHIYGYLSPEIAEDCLTLKNIFLQADFFVVPSFAECFGLVFAEAQSYGLPCVSLNIQGIPGVVDNGKTGLLFPPDSSAQLIAKKIIDLIKDQQAYSNMATAARMKYSNELNWNVFGTKLHDIFKESIYLD